MDHERQPRLMYERVRVPLPSPVPLLALKWQLQEGLARALRVRRMNEQLDGMIMTDARFVVDSLGKGSGPQHDDIAPCGAQRQQGIGEDRSINLTAKFFPDAGHLKVDAKFAAHLDSVQAQGVPDERKQPS